jgi:hypothetical protein
MSCSNTSGVRSIPVDEIGTAIWEIKMIQAGVSLASKGIAVSSRHNETSKSRKSDPSIEAPSSQSLVRPTDDLLHPLT